MEIVFWLALLGSGYSYGVYPLILWLMSRGRAPAAAPPGTALRLSFIIAARNESARIVPKLEDTLALVGSRPVEIIVVSDASEDDTEALAGSLGDARIRVLRQAERHGKESAQALAIAAASGDVLVFSDVATRIAPGSLEALEACFADPGVGAVSSEDRFVSADGVLAGEGLYVRYEMWLRRLESRLAGLVGLSGSFFAARREVCSGWRTDVPSDFSVALTCARRGLRAVTDARVVGIYPDLKDSGEEYARKRRTVIRGMAALAAAAEVLNPLRHGMFSFQVWSHKLLRWAVPWCLLALLLASALLAPGRPGFTAFLLLQLAGYAAVAAAWAWPALRSFGPLRIAGYFVVVNLAMADALLQFLRGRRVVTWEPSRR